MCIIAICETRHLTDVEIHNCFLNNSDGAGLAFPVPSGKVHVEKGFMTEDHLLSYYHAMKELPFFPHVVHFRIATSGDISREMTHPYKMSLLSELAVSEDTECSVLFHNGVISDWKSSLVNLVTSKQIPGMPKGPMNDTRLAAIMASIPEIGDDILEVLSGKFVKVRPDGHIIRWGDFIFDNGIHFSNNGYKWVTYKYNNNCLLDNQQGAKIPFLAGRIDPAEYMTEEDWLENLGSGNGIVVKE